MDNQQKLLTGQNLKSGPALDLEKWLDQRVEGIIQNLSPEYFSSKRWFGSKSRRITGVKALDWALVEEKSRFFGLVILELSFASGPVEIYHLPLAFTPPGEIPEEIKALPDGVITTLKAPGGDLAVYDALYDEIFCGFLYRKIFEGGNFPSKQGSFSFEGLKENLAEAEVKSIKRINTEQSNSSIIFNQAQILKFFRKLAAGKNPDLEIPLFLSARTDFKYIPRVGGFITYLATGGNEISIGVLAEFIRNRGDGYNFTLEQVRGFFDRLEKALAGQSGPVPLEKLIEFSGSWAYQKEAFRLGEITGQMHNALASPSAGQLPDFAPQKIEEEDIRAWQAAIAGLIKNVLENIRQQAGDYSGNLRHQLDTIVAHEKDYLALVANLKSLKSAGVNKTRYHGDYHLGQVLNTGEDFIILDFEGEPARSLEERRARHSPLKDVAGMLRSFDYAAHAVLFEAFEKQKNTKIDQNLEDFALGWEFEARESFLKGYNKTTSAHSGARFLPASPEVFENTLKVFELEKAFYELNYEFNNRPTWVPIPLKGLLRLLNLTPSQ